MADARPISYAQNVPASVPLINLIYVQSSSPLNPDSSDAIARMIRRYTSPKGVVIFDHTYNAGSRAR